MCRKKKKKKLKYRTQSRLFGFHVYTACEFRTPREAVRAAPRPTGERENPEVSDVCIYSSVVSHRFTRAREYYIVLQ